MIGYITGTVLASPGQSCLVLTAGGVGYSVNLPVHTYRAIPGKGEKVAFYTCLVVREEAHELFGFETIEEQQTFDILRAISRIGSRTALAILSTYRPQQLQEIVLNENQAALAKVPGIGSKTAQHILLELRYRFQALPKHSSTCSRTLPIPQSDTLAALANLGYAEEECTDIVEGIFKSEPDLDAASAIRQALKKLAKGRA